ncbi:MAG: hypothetical protein AAF734_12085 [Bacteroidota bacterium]
MNSKKSNWRFLWVIPIALLSFTALAEFAHLDFIVKNMTENSMAHLIVPLGIVKVIIVAVFLYPKTRLIGFLLCTAYIGGIIAAHLIQKDGSPIGFVLQALLWGGIYFEFPHLFQASRFLKEN